MDVTRLLQEMVRVNSVNPGLTAGAPGEPEMVALLRRYLAGLDVEVMVLEGTPGRPTLVATRRGTGGGRSLMLNAHTDTVGVEGMAEPFSGRVEGGRLYGRGSYDMKGGLTAALAAFAEVARGPALRGDLVLAAVADEEFASLGTEELLRHVRTDAAIVTEPTAMDICVAHKGFLWVEIRVAGRAAHGSRPDLGIDANLEMGRVLCRLGELGMALRERAPHPLLGHGSLHAATLRGGTAWSTYSGECVLQVERRLLPGEDAAVAFGEIASAAASHEVSRVFHREPFEAEAGTAFMELVRTEVAAVRGREPALCGQMPWFDAALLAGAGIETLILGHGGAGAHELEEWAELSSLGELTCALVGIARAFCA
jgi:acetylornithine deacetylase